MEYRPVDKSKADAIAHAILAPDSESQETLRRKRAKADLAVAGRRKVALLMLVGFAVGAAVAHFAGERFTAGGWWGAIAGGAGGWLWIGWRNRGRSV